MSDSNNQSSRATLPGELRDRIMNPNRPKNEVEWWAYNRIKALVMALKEVKEGARFLERWKTPDWPAFDEEEDVAMEKLGPSREYDMWLCWRAICRIERVIGND